MEEQFTITLTKDEWIECAEALHNQAYHMRAQFKRTQNSNFNTRADLDFYLGNKIVDNMHMIHVFEEDLRREAHAL